MPQHSGSRERLVACYREQRRLRPSNGPNQRGRGFRQEQRLREREADVPRFLFGPRRPRRPRRKLLDTARPEMAWPCQTPVTQCMKPLRQHTGLNAYALSSLISENSARRRPSRRIGAFTIVDYP